MIDHGYKHTPLTLTDAWRCLYHARCHLLESDHGTHPREAFDLLWAAQDVALTGYGEVDVQSVWRKYNAPSVEQEGSEGAAGR